MMTGTDRFLACTKPISPLKDGTVVSARSLLVEPPSPPEPTSVVARRLVPPSLLVKCRRIVRRIGRWFSGKCRRLRR